MNNFKKIGMSALAASLVSTSVFAGELTASGGASLTMEGYSGTQAETDTTISMGDSVVLSGSTELDNGMTVTMSFEFDGDNVDSVGSSSYDSNSLTIASDALGTMTFHAHGGDTAAAAMDATAAGDMYDNFDELRTGNAKTKAAGLGDNGIFYTLPSMVDGLAVNASLSTASSSAAAVADNTGNSALGFSATYSGVEGLSISYGVTDIETGAAATSGDQVVMKASYAYGPVTAAYSHSDYSVGAANSETLKQEVTSYAVSYTVSDSISVTYGTETIESGAAGSTDAEYEGLSVSYTAGGMTITAKNQEAENISHSTNANEDYDYWSLGLSFAF